MTGVQTCALPISKFTVSQSSTAPAGFINSLLVTSSSAYTVGASEAFGIQQVIEGFNIADLAWGTANAKTVTLSFQVYSSLTGTFGGSLGNVDSSRTYPFSYTISSANTWTQISVTIAGDTSGTWVSNNAAGLNVWFGLGAGTGGAGGANTYSISAETGGTNSADLRLTGQTDVGTTVDNVHFNGGTGITITRTDGNTITIAANSQSFAAAANSVSQNAATGTTTVGQNPGSPTSPALTLPPPTTPGAGTAQPTTLGYPNGNNGLTVTPPDASGGGSGQPSKVGINNPNPTQALDVNGKVKEIGRAHV